MWFYFLFDIKYPGSLWVCKKIAYAVILAGFSNVYGNIILGFNENLFKNYLF